MWAPWLKRARRSPLTRRPSTLNGGGKQLEYTFLRSLTGKYQDFWRVSEQALEFTLQRFALEGSSEQRRRLMEAWLNPSPYPKVATALSRLKQRYPLAILSNGSPKMLRASPEIGEMRYVRS